MHGPRRGAAAFVPRLRLASEAGHTLTQIFPVSASRMLLTGEDDQARWRPHSSAGNTRQRHGVSAMQDGHPLQALLRLLTLLFVLQSHLWLHRGPSTKSPSCFTSVAGFEQKTGRVGRPSL